MKMFPQFEFHDIKSYIPHGIPGFEGRGRTQLGLSELPVQSFGVISSFILRKVHVCPYVITNYEFSQLCYSSPSPN